MLNVLVAFGTRPEAIKLAPVVRELRRRSAFSQLRYTVCVTAQHREMLDDVMNAFSIIPDQDLNVMEDEQTPTHVASAVLNRFERVLEAERPHWVLIQGDTTSMAAVALAAFYARVKVAHVEAGLRTYDRQRPFPEEINRRMAAVIADLHLAPTAEARSNLLREGVPDQSIVVTGNPVIDALLWAVSTPFDIDQWSRAHLGGPLNADGPSSSRLILVTVHRRENFGEPLKQICLALRDLATTFSDVQILFPTHPNPSVRSPVRELLEGTPNVILTHPLAYRPLVHLMRSSSMIITDSGGIQEEAPAFGVPVLVLREATERPEAVEAGAARLVGTDREGILSAAIELLTKTDQYERMARRISPYGDGRASHRIVAALLGEPIEPFSGREWEVGQR